MDKPQVVLHECRFESILIQHLQQIPVLVTKIEGLEKRFDTFEASANTFRDGVTGEVSGLKDFKTKVLTLSGFVSAVIGLITGAFGLHWGGGK